MRITQKEIAEKMGVSISLVSRVLSGSAHEIGVPADTIKEIEVAAKEMGYVPNRAAQALKGKATQTIGVVVYDFKDPFFSDFVATVQEKLHSKGYSTVLVGLSNKQIDERDLSPLREHLLDAVIILGSDFSGAIQGGIQSAPVFRIGHSIQEEASIRYCPNEREVATDLAAYLKSKGSKQVSILSAKAGTHDIRRRVMREAFEVFGFEVETISLNVNPSFDVGREAASQFSEKSTLPDTIVCVNDRLALGLMRGLFDLGIRVPKDVQVTGFDDIRFSHQFYPSLTTFSQPMGDIVDNILRKIQEKDFKPGIQEFSCPLVERESC